MRKILKSQQYAQALMNYKNRNNGTQANKLKSISGTGLDGTQKTQNNHGLNKNPTKIYGHSGGGFDTMLKQPIVRKTMPAAANTVRQTMPVQKTANAVRQTMPTTTGKTYTKQPSYAQKLNRIKQYANSYLKKSKLGGR